MNNIQFELSDFGVSLFSSDGTDSSGLLVSG